tara:strand:- start:550 stop:924 length:375 start_codon:yes stop_codon:yes gene_type:complete
MDQVLEMTVDPTIDATGSSLVGNVKTSYPELVEIFGEPVEVSGDGKVTAEWKIEFAINEDLTWANPMHPGDAHSPNKTVIATIYDWKTGDTPLGEYNWHIGGHNIEAAWFVQDMIDAHRGKEDA